jgi:hypothetical protein
LEIAEEVLAEILNALEPMNLLDPEKEGQS